MYSGKYKHEPILVEFGAAPANGAPAAPKPEKAAVKAAVKKDAPPPKAAGRKENADSKGMEYTKVQNNSAFQNELVVVSRLHIHTSTHTHTHTRTHTRARTHTHRRPRAVGRTQTPKAWCIPRCKLNTYLHYPGYTRTHRHGWPLHDIAITNQYYTVRVNPKPRAVGRTRTPRAWSTPRCK